MEDGLEASMYFLFQGLIVFFSILTFLFQMRGMANIDMQALFQVMNAKMYEVYEGTLSSIMSLF